MGRQDRLAILFAGITAAAAFGSIAPSIVGLPVGIVHADSATCVHIAIDINSITRKIRALTQQIEFSDSKIRALERQIRETTRYLEDDKRAGWTEGQAKNEARIRELKAQVSSLQKVAEPLKREQIELLKDRQFLRRKLRECEARDASTSKKPEGEVVPQAPNNAPETAPSKPEAPKAEPKPSEPAPVPPKAEPEPTKPGVEAPKATPKTPSTPAAPIAPGAGGTAPGLSLPQMPADCCNEKQAEARLQQCEKTMNEAWDQYSKVSKQIESIGKTRTFANSDEEKAVLGPLEEAQSRWLKIAGDAKDRCAELKRCVAEAKTSLECKPAGEKPAPKETLPSPRVYFPEIDYLYDQLTISNNCALYADFACDTALEQRCKLNRDAVAESISAIRQAAQAMRQQKRDGLATALLYFLSPARDAPYQRTWDNVFGYYRQHGPPGHCARASKPARDFGSKRLKVKTQGSPPERRATPLPEEFRRLAKVVFPPFDDLVALRYPDDLALDLFGAPKPAGTGAPIVSPKPGVRRK